MENIMFRDLDRQIHEDWALGDLRGAITAIAAENKRLSEALQKCLDSSSDMDGSECRCGACNNARRILGDTNATE
jgi:hypothetical protein